MVTLATLQTAIEYQCQDNLNLYDSPDLKSLATQAIAGRQLRIVSSPAAAAVAVQLCEDDYPGWVAIEDLDLIEPAAESYAAIALDEAEIAARLPQVIAYAEAAMRQPNHYLWGGTIGPNYDCSGLMQAAFLAAGIWLPRDAYQQADFAQRIDRADLRSGDLVFFASGDRITHVGLYLVADQYIHSSGKDQGRNGIAIDLLSESTDAIGQAYFRQFHSAGRIVASYQPMRDRQKPPSGSCANETASL
ncbi:MAG: C40 family peptidase [Microcoleus sp. SIO2G3]|nr:C40 family peptidase [Microcoleus sp. SIO2G3]